MRTEQQRLRQRRQELERRRRLAEDLYLSGTRDRAWFDALDGPLTIELDEIAIRIEDIPTAPPLADVVARHEALARIAGDAHLLLPASRGAILARLGTVVVEGGTEVFAKPPIAIRFRREVAPFIRPEFTVAEQ